MPHTFQQGVVMGATAIRFENWLPSPINSGVQWWPSPPPPGSEPATTEPQKPEPEPGSNDATPQLIPANDGAGNSGRDRP
ncbi:hypothetical protein [uncultured Nevskia sp.]|uniref:hypothetical protein n=1 Tax=uncultured Nevskia sp. TaxID=228950 RepID=UPI0025F325D5|nr:hypothetical protein [uncultured Nevskia sp.]